jgi:hypothetical protein
LRVEGKSFREIGRELGISQVAAWKLWQQTMEDVIEQACAEREGLRRLAEAWQQLDVGDEAPIRRLRADAARVYGIRVTQRLLGGFSPGTPLSECREARCS